MAIIIEPHEKKILDSIAIPPCPTALMTIISEAKKDDPKFPIIVEAIMSDPSTAGAVLKVVNSPAFRRANAITSIEQALSMLGIKRILAIVNAVAVRNAMPGSEDLDDFWDNASYIANCCVLISKFLKNPALADDAYTLGLFHSAGIPVMLAAFDDYSEFYKRSTEEAWSSLINDEKDTYQTTHLTIGALMAQGWGLPDSIVNAIYNLHYDSGIYSTDDLSDDALVLLSYLKIARYISHNHTSEEEWQEIDSQLMSYLKLGDEEIEDLRFKVMTAIEDE